MNNRFNLPQFSITESVFNPNVNGDIIRKAYHGEIPIEKLSRDELIELGKCSCSLARSFLGIIGELSKENKQLKQVKIAAQYN